MAGLAQEQVPAPVGDSEWDGDVATVTVRGDIDTTTVGVLAESLGKLVARHPERLPALRSSPRAIG